MAHRTRRSLIQEMTSLRDLELMAILRQAVVVLPSGGESNRCWEMKKTRRVVNS